MKKQIRTILTLIMMLCLAVQFVVLPAYADRATIDAPSSVYMGEEFTVKVTFTCDDASGIGAIASAYIKFDPNELQCTYNEGNGNETSPDGAGKYTLLYAADNRGTASKTFTFKFKALKSGSFGIYTTGTIRNWDESGPDQIKEASVKINSIDKSTLSGNANLKSLILSAGTLNPAFSPSVTNYNITVDYSVTSVLVSAVTQEGAATIDVQGSSKMKVGDNKRTVVVTAPNGTKKSYVLNIKRLASGETNNPTPTDPQEPNTPDINPYEVIIDGQKKYLANDYSLVQIPEGFTVTSSFINGTDIPSITNTVGDRVLVYATDETGANGRFYLFDAEKMSYTLYMNYSTTGTTFVLIDYKADPVVPAGYYYCPVQIGDYSFNGFKYEDGLYSNFSIVYAEASSGAKAFYRYDKSDGSFQKAAEFTLALEEAKKNTVSADADIFTRFMNMNIKGKAVIIAILLVVVVGAVLLIVNIVKKNKKAPQPKEIDNVAEVIGTQSNLFYTGNEDFDDDNVASSPIRIDSAYHLNPNDEDKE